MDLRTPADWVFDAADRHPDAPALAFADGMVTYDQLAGQVHARAATLRSEWDTGDHGSAATLVGVPVSLDLPSIVEVLACQRAGLIPMPHADEAGSLHGRASGCVLVVRTSGSGGRRRMVPLTMENIEASVVASRSRLGTGSGDRWLLTLPIDHIGGLSVLFRSFEAAGTAVVGRFGSDTTALIRTARPTVASLVPTMAHRLLESDPEALASIGLVLIGGGRLPAAVANRATGAGVRFVATYGSTETGSQAATMEPGEPMRHAGYVGRPLDGFSIGIEEPDDDGVGRILVDGPAVFGGYVGEAERDGPHRSTDLGSLAPDGSLTILGRMDDVVVTGGHNVSLIAIEDALAQVAGVTSAVVVAIEDDEWGSAVCALVATEHDLDDVRARAQAALAGHGTPRRWRRGPIPLLANGKPDRIAVRAMFAEQ